LDEVIRVGVNGNRVLDKYAFDEMVEIKRKPLKVLMLNKKYITNLYAFMIEIRRRSTGALSVID